MNTEIKVDNPFVFITRLHLSELTGIKAYNILELVNHLKEISGSSIYHHTHRFLQQHQFLSPEPPNDFFYWISEILGEKELGEKLASIDIMLFSDIRSLREKIVSTIEDHISANPQVKFKYAHEGEEFHFVKSISFIIPTNYIAYNLNDFVNIFEKITIDSIYFHIFESRLRLEKSTNDFSNWIENEIGDKQLADKIAGLDPYTYTLEDLRKMIISIIKKRFANNA